LGGHEAADISPAQTQDPAKSSYQSFPRPEDFRIEPEWPALRVFNFIRGVRELGQPFLETEPGRRCLIVDALSWHTGPGPYPMDETRENTRLLRCYNGAVILHIEGYQ
jgi:methionyl-tRNA formyltransferase